MGKPNPYCDKLSDEQRSETDCWDRKDYYQGGPKDGLYPCNDGSARQDWQDCPDVSGYNYDNNNNNNDNDNDNEDRGEANCGGEPCTATEKEDSWTDDETEGEGLNEDGEWVDEDGEEICYEDNNGSLGERVPCE